MCVGVASKSGNEESILKRTFVAAILIVVLALSLFAPTTVLADGDIGENLVRRFFADSQSRDQASIEKALAEGFQSVHTDGVRDREGELELIRNIKLGTHTLANFKTTRNGSVLVVTFEVNAPGETLAGKTAGEGTYQRMAIWIETESGWQLIAYANLAPLKK